MKYLPFGISFKGGAARGLGAIGVVRFFQENNLKPVVVAGSSSGAIVAAAYALGFKWNQIVEMAKEIKISKLISIKDVLSLKSLSTWDHFRKILKAYSADKNIEDLPVKLLMFTTSSVSGERIVVDKGSLIEAILASSAYPVLFPPFVFNDKDVFDGDLSTSFSVRDLKGRGARKVIGVGYDASLPLTKKKDIGGPVNRAIDIYRILMKQVGDFNDRGCLPDICISYGAADHSYLDFKNIDRIVDRAYDACLKKKDEILNLLNP